MVGSFLFWEVVMFDVASYRAQLVGKGLLRAADRLVDDSVSNVRSTLVDLSEVSKVRKVFCVKTSCRNHTFTSERKPWMCDVHCSDSDFSVLPVDPDGLVDLAAVFDLNADLIGFAEPKPVGVVRWGHDDFEVMSECSDGVSVRISEGVGRTLDNGEFSWVVRY
jgi:hypothetical protein